MSSFADSFPPQFFIANREKLRQVVGNELFVFSAYSEMQRKGDAAFAFEQEANFFYLTGITAPDWKVIIEGEKTTLIAPVVSDAHQLFDGSLSQERAKELSGAMVVLSNEEGEHYLSGLAVKYDEVATVDKDAHEQYYDFSINPAQEALSAKLKKIFKKVNDCRPQLAKLRAIKQPEEIAALRSAIDISIETFRSVYEKKVAHQFKTEYEIEAVLSYGFRNQGASGHAYDPIVASAGHACTLHYSDNDDTLPENGLVLIDAGAQVYGYAADITRTYSLGVPSEREVAVHAQVEQAHKKIIDLIQPGFSVKEYSKQVDEIMKNALSSLGLLNREDDFRTYFPHAISHGLGLEVHDSLGAPDVFIPGMVLTVEPGIYIPEEAIGVRIEDDILVTEDGNENLSGTLKTSL